MAASNVDRSDIQALSQFFEQDIWNKVRQLMDSTRTQILPKLPKPIRNAKYPKPDAWGRYDILWDYAYCFKITIELVRGLGIYWERRIKILRDHFSEATGICSRSER